MKRPLPTSSLRRLTTSIAAVATSVLVIPACVGGEGLEPDVQPQVIDYDDVTPRNPVRDAEDIGPPPVVVPDGIGTLSGNVRNWVSNEYAGDFTLSSYGLSPPLSGSADNGGAYSVDVQVAGTFYASTYKEGYERAYTKVTMPAGDYTATLYAVSSTDNDNWYTTFNKTPEAGCGTLLVTTRGIDGQPQNNVTGLRLGGVPAYEGPYYLDDYSQPDNTLDGTSASGRAVFLNVCGIIDGLDVSVSADEGPYVSGLAYASVFTDAIAFAEVNVFDNPNGVDPVEPEPEPPPVDIIDFPTEIFPIFQAYGCAACHSAQGTAAGSGLYFDVAPENAYAALREGTSRVNLADPAASYVLSYPLIAQPPNGGHPNGSWTTVDAAYQDLLQWIEQGAPYGVEEPPPPVEPVVFEDVYHRFQTYDAQTYPYGRGCTACHNAQQAAGGLDLTGGPDAVFQRLVDGNLYNLQDVSSSRILREPYCGPDYCANDPVDPVTHSGGRIFYTPDDPDYQLIYQWIAQGALHDVEPPPPEPVIPTDVDFNYDFQYRLSTRTCTGCHNVQSASGGLNLEGTPYDVCTTVQGLVTPNDYANSIFFTKANAYYDQVGHGGGKIIPNNDDPFSLYLRGWIDEGAQCDNTIPPVDFDTQVYPLFAGALNCTGCHSDAQQQGGLSLEGGAEAAFTNLQNSEALTAYQPYNSTLITKPFDVYVDNHPANRAVQTYYREYQVILDWVMEGANRP